VKINLKKVTSEFKNNDSP